MILYEFQSKRMSYTLEDKKKVIEWIISADQLALQKSSSSHLALITVQKKE